MVMSREVSEQGSTITYRGYRYIARRGESVLACLRRNGQQVPYSCNAGVCQSCLMKAESTEPPERAQNGLKDVQRRQGLFLACQWYPKEDIEVALADAEEASVPAMLTELFDLNHNTKAVHLRPDRTWRAQPGQYISLVVPGRPARSYSIANIPDRDGHIALHIRRVKNGKLSSWLDGEAKPGDRVHIRGPFGACCYSAKIGRGRPLLLAGTGTGLAPLRGIVLDALMQGHEGDVCLLHGAIRRDDLYCVEELSELEGFYSNFEYLPCVLEGEPPKGGTVADIGRVLLERATRACDPEIFLCGAADFVMATRKALFLSGVPSRRFNGDAFYTAADGVLPPNHEGRG